MLTLKADEYQNVGLHVLFSQFGVTDLQPARSHSRLDRNRGLVTARRDKHRTFIQEIRVHVMLILSLNVNKHHWSVPNPNQLFFWDKFIQTPKQSNLGLVLQARNG